MRTKNYLYLAGSLISLTACSILTNKAVEKQRPNILFVMTNDHTLCQESIININE